MILRQKTLRLFSLLLLSSFVHAFEDSTTLDCSGPLLIDGLKYDLSQLSGEYSATRERPTPPTREIDEARISLCSDLKRLDEVPDADQCAFGARVCLTRTNYKDGKETILSVVPAAQTEVLAPKFTTLKSPKGVSILLHGGLYPHPMNSTELGQTVTVNLLCATTTAQPGFVDYDGANLNIEWSTPAGCGFYGDEQPPPQEDDETEPPEIVQPSSGGLSSVGWFLLLLVLAFATYMGLGAYSNYTQYGASGLDLLPHRDFWMEVPWMLRDVVSHLCSSVRPRRSHRGGYSAV
ncbi:hypothetical protein HMN09_01372200 [Mycena chlorophos]|uniref:Autophagy-related protein 27 n=1 Tax=Mycena chlorophos TaxID=658473 RepID=A0A8H6VNV5_MYCCL|nr:hypothetical protein HMN09_01372200 [Mycena chlorophos]